MPLLTSPAKRPPYWLRWLTNALAVVLTSSGILFAVGDFGLAQRVLNGVESRALAGKTTRADLWGLRMLYGALQQGGRVMYPHAAEMLDYYCHGLGDTLRFDARPLLRHPDVQQAVRLHKPGITFRHQANAGPFYAARRTDLALYYAFDLLYIRRLKSEIVFYDNYFFQPVARRSYTRFSFGNAHCKLNDGLIHEAYPEAKSFIAYSKVTVSQRSNFGLN